VHTESGAAEPRTEQPDQEAPLDHETWDDEAAETVEVPWSSEAGVVPDWEANARPWNQFEDSPFVVPELFAAQPAETTDVAVPFELPGELDQFTGGGLDEHQEEAWAEETWEAPTLEETFAQDGGGVHQGQVTVGVTELLGLWDTTIALNQHIRRMVGQALEQGRILAAPTAPVVPAAPLVGPLAEQELEDGPEPGIQQLIDKGWAENRITEEVFAARNPTLRGQKVRAGSKQADQWSAIRSNLVRPAVRKRLQRSIIDPMQLGVFVSYYDKDKKIPPDITAMFLTGSPLLSMSRSLRDWVLSEWQSRKPPVTISRLSATALDLSGHPGTAMLLCHNVLRAFARGSTVLPWDRVPSDPETYSDGSKVWTPRVIHPDGKLIKGYYKLYDRVLTSIFYVLFSAKELGTEDPGDWYHVFVTATFTAYGGRNELSPGESESSTREMETEDRDRDKRGEGTVQDLTDDLYPWLVIMGMEDVERQMTDPGLAGTPGYRGWIMANVVSFMEGGLFGHSPQDAERESRRHLQGAVLGLKAAGVKPDKNWVWLVPIAKSMKRIDLLRGFPLQGRVDKVLDARGQTVGASKKGSK
jgi:hypothetical protein